MGEHGTWTDLLYRLPGWRNLHDFGAGYMARDKQALVFAESHFTLTHVVWTVLVTLFVFAGCMSFRRSVTAEGGILPAPACRPRRSRPTWPSRCSSSS